MLIMDHLDAIAAVNGFDMLFFGAGDYSHSLGVPGQMDHPEVRDARKRVGEAARRHGKAAGLIAVGPDQITDALQIGYNFISLGADVIAINQYFEQQLQIFVEAMAKS